MLADVYAELERLEANSVRVAADREFEPKVADLIKVEIGSAYWHLPHTDLLQLLRDLPDGAGEQEIQMAIESKAPKVWHGPEPKGSRDTAP